MSNEALVARSSAPSQLVERCAAMDIPLWVCDGGGAILCEPESPQPVVPWLVHRSTRAIIQQFSTMCAEGQPSACHAVRLEAIDDCWIIPMPLEGAGGFMLAMAWLPGIVESAVVRNFLDSSRDCAAAVADSLRQFARASVDEIQRLAQVLRWMCDDAAASSQTGRTLDQFSDKLIQSYEETNMLFRIARVMNGVADPMQMMQLVCNQLRMTLPFQWVAIQFSDKCTSVPELTGQMILSGELPCGIQDFRNEVVKLLDGWLRDDWTRLLEPSRSTLARLVGSEVVADSISHDGAVIGTLLAGNKLCEDRDLSSAETQFIDALADFLGVFHENLARFSEQRLLFMGTLKALTASIDAKDRYTCGHSERVALLAAQMAQAMNLGKIAVEQYHIAGLVHDVGKIGVPEAVLCKPAHLSEAEYELIRRHPRIGYDILKDIRTLEPMLPGVLHHHERWDGRGYPAGLAGADIPLVARVLAMADAFDAMSSNRAYRPAMTREQVFAEIRRCAGTQFDPEIAALFITLDHSAFDAMLERQRHRDRLAA